MSEMLKKMMQDARNWKTIEEGLKEQVTQPIEIVAITKTNVHLKGYIYDSLVFRYMKARDAEAELEMKKEGITYEKAKSRADRDKMRFMQILNEAIGEHD
jgi:hypothetical protein